MLSSVQDGQSKLLLNAVQKVIFHLEAFVAKFMRVYEG